MSYLLIENPVKETPSIELMRMLGASGSRGESAKIGQFGSGFPYSLALLARHGLLQGTKICLGKDVYTFEIEEHYVNDSIGRNHVQHEIRMRRQNGASWDLNISTEFGAIDWRDASLAVREFISNACDGSLDYDGTYRGVRIDSNIPDEGRMTRAKEGFVRVYIPINDEIQEYVDNIPKYFRCLQPRYNSTRQISINVEGGPARVYRKGVFTGQFGEHSLFHYDISNLPINESRLVDSYTAKTYCAHAIARSKSSSIISKYLLAKMREDNVFEKDLYVYDLSPKFFPAYEKEEMFSAFREAINHVMKNKIACLSNATFLIVNGKGYESILVDSDLHALIKEYGGKTELDVLNKNEIAGKELIPATPQALAVLDRVWTKLEQLNMTVGKVKPGVVCFIQHTRDGGMEGYYRANDGNIYVRNDLADNEGINCIHIILHELAHYITGAQDFTYEFQEFSFKLSAMLMKEGFQS